MESQIKAENRNTRKRMNVEAQKKGGGCNAEMMGGGRVLVIILLCRVLGKGKRA